MGRAARRRARLVRAAGRDRVKRLLLLALLSLAPLALASAPARAAACGLPDATPLWIDYAESSVKFREAIFRRPGLVLATSGPAVAQSLRAGGAATIHWEMNLPRLVGTPDAPADPGSIPAAAGALFDRAVRSSACPTPLIALNELWSPTVPAPWTPTNAQYRANVLTLLRELAARGARPFLLVPSNPNTAGESADWWRQAATVADVVREVYVPGPLLAQQGALLGSREIRLRLRRAVSTLAAVGIPPARVGLMLGFQSGGLYGRVGLQPLPAWLEVTKWLTLAARQVGADTGAGTIWSWGWGSFSAADDPDKPVAACVFLWTRDPALCDAPAAAAPYGGFNTSLTDGQIALPAGVECTTAGGVITTRTIERLTAATGDRERAKQALLARLVQRAAVRVPARAILAAERALVGQRFGGQRRAYLAALRRHGLDVALARDLLADQIRRGELARRVAPTSLAAWTEAEATKALATTTCLRDELPAAGDVDVTSALASVRPPPRTAR
ncbi:MAG: hypothetical protein ICV64_12085 [Thermoleophilia bacterium]|nr:hypothetical protein [Thermoleophilia bacterium]